MSGSLFKKNKKGGESDGRPPVAMLRSVGRVALWAAVGLLLVRGAEGSSRHLPRKRRADH